MFIDLEDPDDQATGGETGVRAPMQTFEIGERTPFKGSTELPVGEEPRKWGLHIKRKMAFLIGFVMFMSIGLVVFIALYLTRMYCILLL